jgi:hypothetical protein
MRSPRHLWIDRGRRGLRRDATRQSGCGSRLGRRDLSAVAWRIDRRGSRGRQEEQRVEVTLLVARLPDPEVHVRHLELGHAARADGSDDVALSNDGPAPNAERTKVHERDGVAVRGLDRHGLACVWHGAGERDRSVCRRDDRGSLRGADVDSPVLAARVRVRRIERERDQHRPCHRPGPAERRSRDDECGDGR